MVDMDFVKRYEGNPILTRDDGKHFPGGCNAIFNGTVFPYGNGYKAVLRTEERSGVTYIRCADSKDGIHFDIEKDRILEPDTDYLKAYEEVIYDPRVSLLDGKYYITYAAENKHGCQVAMASTTDFKTFERYGCIAEPENRNLVLFPEKINGKYFRLDRPFQNKAGYIWCQESPDLYHWGNPRVVMESRQFHWDRGKIGPGAPPIRIDEGWLVIYHGVTPLANNLEYRVGVAILDANEPWKVLHRAKAYVLSPDAPYERMGDTPNCIFICNALANKEKDELKMYYAAADQVMCLATCKLSDMIDFAKTR
jgi:predicted GH43/DUF377 family glycosyl hydrolase